VREYSEKFDKWSPPSFKLSESEIAGCVRALPSGVIDDIKFAQTQIRNFALTQRAALQDVEVQTLPGVVLGHKNIPSTAFGCYVPGGRYPLVGLCAHERGYREGGRRQAHHCERAAFGGKPHPAIVAAMHFGGADEIYAFGGVQAIAAMALGRKTSRRRHARGTRNAFRCRSQAPVVRTRRHRLAAGPTETLIIADDHMRR